MILIVLVLVHEAGHMVVAKWCGMRVERFSIFFGPPDRLVHAGRDRVRHRLAAARRLREDHRDDRRGAGRPGYDPETGALVAEIPEPPEVQARAYSTRHLPEDRDHPRGARRRTSSWRSSIFAVIFWIGVPSTANDVGAGVVTSGLPAQTAGLQRRRPSPGRSTACGATATRAPLRAELQSGNPGKSVTVVVARGGDRRRP